MTNTLLISEKYVKTQSNIQDNVWGDFLTPAIREAQDIELQPIIGRPLYKKILKEVEEKDVEERFKTLIEDWIQPYLLYQTIVSLIPIIGTKLGNIGTVISNDEHVQNISSSERENLEYRYRYLADHYKSELQKYLLANKDLYPELTSTCLKNLNLKSSNSLPLWTGGLRHGQRESTDCPDKADYADPDGRKAGYIEGGKTVSVTKNNATTTVLPSEGYDGISSVEVEVNVPIQDKKTVEITSTTGTTTIVPDEGYDGIKEVELNINATLPQILFEGQKLNSDIYINIDSDEIRPLTDFFNFKNISNFNGVFTNFSLSNKNKKIIFNYDYSPLNNVEISEHYNSRYFYINTYKLEPAFRTHYSSYEYPIEIYAADIPNIKIKGTYIPNYIIFYQGSSNEYVKIDIRKIDFSECTHYSGNYSFATNLYIEDKDYFKFFEKYNPIERYSPTYLIESICFTNENEFLNLNYLYKYFKNDRDKVYAIDLEYSYGNIDISDTIITDRDMPRMSSYSTYCNKILFSEKCFSGNLNSYYLTSRTWTDQQNLQDFIDVLPQNTTSRTIKLSSNTMNALTDEMKATAANKNWTLTT